MQRATVVEPAPRSGAGAAAIYFIWLIAAWIGAWTLFQTIQMRGGYAVSQQAQFAYWTLMKITVWVIPAMCVIRLSGRTFAEVMGIARWRAVLTWGGGAGAALAFINMLAKSASSPFTPLSIWPELNAGLVSPVVEEIAFRGAVMGGFMRRGRFAIANTITATMFVAAHIPGWWFQGRLAEQITKPLGGALTIFILGWIFGLVVYKSKSICSGIIAHSLNNFTA